VLLVRPIAKNCWAKARCGHCSKSHGTLECPIKTPKTGSCAACKALGYKKTDHKAWDELCPVRISAREKLYRKLETRPYLYSVAVDPDRRPLARPSQGTQLGRPHKGAVQADLEPDRDSIDVDAGRENKRKRQLTLSFPTVEMETDPALEQLGG
jgi:hypothetical protein